MANTRNHHRSFVLATLAALAGCSGSSQSNTAPRLSTVPNQSISSGATLTLDLQNFVTNKEGDALTWTVTSSEGATAAAFSGSTFTGAFNTLGTYTVGFRVTDALGKSGTGTIPVKVQTANFAAVTEGDDLLLLDTDTSQFLTVGMSPSAAETYKASLGKGCVVFERLAGGNYDLFAYDANTRMTYTLGNASDKDERYVAKTTTGKVVFTAGTATDTDLYLWNPVTNITRTLSNGLGQHDRNAYVNASDLVFFERGVGGQADIAYYDVANDEVVAVSDNPGNEAILCVMPNGAIMFSRIADTGERDLFYFRVGTGLVEVGAGSTNGPLTKTWCGATSDSKVVFQVTTGAADQDLWIWDPGTSTTRNLANSAVDETFAGVTPMDDVAYQVATSSSNSDLKLYRWSTNLSATVANSSDNEVYEAALSNGDVVYARHTAAAGIDLYRYSRAGASAAAIASASTSDYEFWKVLANDHVVFGLHATSTTYSALYDYNAATTTTATVVSGDGRFAQEHVTSGNFVYTLVSGAQTDIYLWNGASNVQVYAGAADDTFCAITAAGDVLFSSYVSPGRYDLYLWRIATSAAAQLTQNVKTHGVDAVFAVDNS